VKLSEPSERMAEKSKDGIGEDTSEKLEDQDDLVDYECDLTLEMNKELSIYLGAFLIYIYRSGLLQELIWARPPQPICEKI